MLGSSRLPKFLMAARPEAFVEKAKVPLHRRWSESSSMKVLLLRYSTETISVAESIITWDLRKMTEKRISGALQKWRNSI